MADVQIDKDFMPTGKVWVVEDDIFVKCQKYSFSDLSEEE